MSLSHRGARRKRKAQSYILIGDGFEELEAIFFLHKFRRAGLPIKSVSLFDKIVYSRQGVGLKADFSLIDDPFTDIEECLLILPAGGRNGSVLRRDARVKALLQRLSQQGDVTVVVTDGASRLADDVGRLMSRPTLHPSIGQDLTEFIDLLIERLT